MIYRLPANKKLGGLCSMLFILPVMVLCLGCQTGSNLPGSAPSVSSEPGDDLTALVKEQAKATLYEPKYHTVADAKLAICQFKALPQDINTIANAFDMTEIKSDKTLKYIHYDEKNSRLGTLFSQGKNVRAYGVFGHPAKLKCKSGKAFEYMLIFYKPETNEASIETCLAN